MLNAVKKNNTAPLLYLPAKIIPVKALNKIVSQDIKKVKKSTGEILMNKNESARFCEPVFKPKKHDFL